MKCHVDNLEEQDREAHTVPDHSFQASVKTCNTCHSDQMHGPTEASLPLEGEGTAPVESTAEAVQPLQYSAVTPEPSPVSPVGYAGLAGLVGLAAGMVLAPWLERFYHRVTRHHPHSEE